jgi:hypothetical protein
MGVSAKDYGLTSPISKQVTSSQCVKEGYGRLRGIFVNAAKLDPSIELLDNTINGNPVIVREFPVAGATYYHMGDVSFGTGLYAVLAGTVSATFIYF